MHIIGERVIRGSRVYEAWLSALEALLALAILGIVDIALALRGFPGVHRLVKRFRVAERNIVQEHERERIVAAFEAARRLYFKRVKCLHGSAAAVCFLRLRRVPAQLTVGVRPMPFASHAWVEVDGEALLADVEIGSYAVIDRL